MLDQTLQERTNALATSIGQGADMLNKTLADRTGQFNAIIDQKAALLDQALVERAGAFMVAVDERASAMDKSLHDRTAQFITAINQGAIALDKTLAERSETFTNSLFQRVKALETAISQQTATLDQTMMERAQAVIVALAERLQGDRRHVRPAHGRNRPHARRARAGHRRDVRQADRAAQSGARQQLRRSCSRPPIRSARSRRKRYRSSPAKPRRCARCHAACSSRSTASPSASRIRARPSSPPPRRSNSSNTKIDSILEGRHQAIIALLHTVNTKSQDLDNMMRSYAGMVENAMSHAEARAKQVGTALARDTSGQAQAALAQIERLREEAQAHTARAVNDLKGSFETVITQIGRQLEQMRGQFDNTSRGMREAAQQTATDLDSLRQEMQKRMEALPEHTAQATAAIRKALSEQLREIEAITPTLPRVMPAASPDRSLSRRRPAAAIRRSRTPAAAARGGDIGQVAGGLAQQLAGASYAPPRGQGPAGGQWSVGDLLTRASAPDQGYGGAPGFGARARRRLSRAVSSVSMRSRAPSTTARRPRCGSASGPASAACSDGISTISTAKPPSTRSRAATTARAISA